MRALIFGISGQDGSYLAKHLLDLGYEVYGTTRDSWSYKKHNLDYLGIRHRLKILSMDLTDFRSVLNVVSEVRPVEVYNLAGQTSVRLSFEQPVEAMDSIGRGTLNCLEVIRFIDPSIRFFNACSSDCFGNSYTGRANEDTPFSPTSPYGVAKATAHYLVQNYRVAYDLFASSGILFNHESELRSKYFVTQKIVTAAARISNGSPERLKLGNLDIARDWGWAPDFVVAMRLMLQADEPEDFVVATGKTTKLEDFVDKVFSYFDLDWKLYVDTDDSLLRPSDIAVSGGDASKAKNKLGWVASRDVEGVIEAMCSAVAEE